MPYLSESNRIVHPVHLLSKLFFVKRYRRFESINFRKGETGVLANKVYSLITRVSNPPFVAHLIIILLRSIRTLKFKICYIEVVLLFKYSAM